VKEKKEKKREGVQHSNVEWADRQAGAWFLVLQVAHEDVETNGYHIFDVSYRHQAHVWRKRLFQRGMTAISRPQMARTCGKEGTQRVCSERRI
jgi:hypothetical protein